MRVSAGRRSWLALFLALLPVAASEAQGTRDTTTYRRMKAALDAIPMIDTHDHLLPFDDALRIGRQILRDNALALFPQLEKRLWKHKVGGQGCSNPESHLGAPRSRLKVRVGVIAGVGGLRIGRWNCFVRALPRASPAALMPARQPSSQGNLD